MKKNKWVNDLRNDSFQSIFLKILTVHGASLIEISLHGSKKGSKFVDAEGKLTWQQCRQLSRGGWAWRQTVQVEDLYSNPWIIVLSFAT